MSVTKNQIFEVSKNGEAKSIEIVSYEVLHLADGSSEIWRTREGYYPEQAYTHKWISDFGLGDYNYAVRNSTHIDKYNSAAVLPSDIQKRIAPANQVEEERKAMLALPINPQTKTSVFNSPSLLQKIAMAFKKKVSK